MIDRLSAVASIAVRHANAYTDLILSDLEATSAGVRSRVVAGAVMACASVLAVAMACVWLIAATWDTAARIWVIAGLLALFLAIAAAAFWRLKLLAAGAPGMLALTAGEWAKDRQLLEELLEKERAVSS
ncbi:MAG TPA: hypothetical protein VK676_06285 [Steroidobacteraceae bacterium]|jgi:uncharacterized membrane protein YqjE|nr:hypothetical protein [Steroidobacteraceae bacterium]